MLFCCLRSAAGMLRRPPSWRLKAGMMLACWPNCYHRRHASSSISTDTRPLLLGRCSLACSDASGGAGERAVRDGAQWCQAIMTRGAAHALCLFMPATQSSVRAWHAAIVPLGRAPITSFPPLPRLPPPPHTHAPSPFPLPPPPNAETCYSGKRRREDDSHDAGGAGDGPSRPKRRKSGSGKTYGLFD